jgi:transposase-like protein
MTIDELETLRLKGLTNKLLADVPIEELADEFQVTIPPALTLKFVCPNCTEEFPVRVITKDMGSINRYIKCPHCRNSSYLSTIQTVGKEQKALNDLLFWLGEED